MKYRVKIDGGAQPNPGKAACAAVFYHNQIYVPFVGYSKFLGNNISNNVAEHNAFILALEVAIENKYSTLTVESDSKVVVNQFNGDWQVNEPNLKSLVALERELALKLSRLEVTWVGRDNVWEAHYLVEHEIANPLVHFTSPIASSFTPLTRSYTTCALDPEDGLWKPIYDLQSPNRQTI